MKASRLSSFPKPGKRNGRVGNSLLRNVPYACDAGWWRDQGGAGNFPDDRAFVYETRLEAAQATDKDEPLKEFRSYMRGSYAALWLAVGPNARPNQLKS